MVAHNGKGEASASPAARPVRLFDFGQLFMTPGIRDLVAGGLNIAALLKRHAFGDWGDLTVDDWQANERAIVAGARIFSAYAGPDGARIWIITEADRSATTVLLAEEY